MCLQDGVTGWVDAGTGGADNMDAVAAVARGAPQIGRCLVNIARTGVIIPPASCTTSTTPTWRWREERLRATVTWSSASRRACRTMLRAPTISKRCAQEAAAAFNLPVMIHIGQNYSPLRAILALLKRGDIVTHMYAPGMNGILDDKGILLPDVLAARRRGIIFDFGNGVADHFDWDSVEKATKQGLWPDTFSTDWNTTSKTSGVVDLPNVMSKFMYGMPLSQIIACATANAARCFPSFDDRGTLNVGAPADVAIMELRKGSFEFLDNYKGTRTGRQRLFPAETVLAGKRIPHA
jgi:dihydroorotase